MEPDPVTALEDRNTWLSFGKQAHLIYLGARENGASKRLAFGLTSAFFAGLMRGSLDNDDSDA